jgi:uncharacterized Ntn-hydrolase superfamily protein
MYLRGEQLKKSTIIATCLVNSNMINRIDDAENRVYQVFIDEFPASNFAEWNQEINESVARQIIKNVGRTSRINVKLFIEELWK